MSRIAKLKKLRRMSVDEIRVRCGNVLSRRIERQRWRERKSGSISSSYSTNPIDCLNRCVQIVPGSNSLEIVALKREFPHVFESYRLQIEQRSATILNSKWTMLGHPFDLTGDVCWHSDPRTGYSWDRTFYSDLPLYNLAGETDVKYPWELSRHQFLCELARNFRFNKCERSANRVKELLIDWIDQNPLYEGVNWTSGLEVAMRAISWIWTLAGLTSWSGWEESDLIKICASLRDHADYLASNFSYFSSPYNHLIGEATGLLCIATVLGVSDLSSPWQFQARKTLTQAGPSQFYGDHFCVEQAVGYHYYTLGFLLTAWNTARLSGKPLHELANTIRLALKTGVSFRRPNGSWPSVGDLDSARSIPVFPNDSWSFDSINDTAAVLLDEDNLKLTGSSPGEDLFWFGGTDGVRRWYEIPVASPASFLQLHRDSGYVVASDGSDWMLFDAGPVAGGLFEDATPSTAHGHADSLQVLYFSGGRALLDDSGMPFYGGSSDWVSYFRSPAAHNTVQIEGADVVRHAGRLAWSHHVDRPDIDARSSDSMWLCGGKLQWPTVQHQRHVCCIPGEGIWIADLISTKNPRSANWYWQLPEESESTSENLVSWQNCSLSCVSTEDNKIFNLQSASDSSPIGWRCFDYGMKSPGKRLKLQFSVCNSLLVLTSVGIVNRRKLGVQLQGKQLTETAEFQTINVRTEELAGCQWLIPSCSIPLQSPFIA